LFQGLKTALGESRQFESALTRRWKSIYYAISVFIFALIFIALAGNYYSLKSYKETIHENQKIVDLLDGFNNLIQASIEINSPGNSIFESKNEDR